MPITIFKHGKKKKKKSSLKKYHVLESTLIIIVTIFCIKQFLFFSKDNFPADPLIFLASTLLEFDSDKYLKERVKVGGIGKIRGGARNTARVY